MSTLAGKLDALRTAMEKKLPAEMRERMHRGTEELRTSGILDTVLGVGDTAPDWELEASDGKLVRSEDLLAKGPLILSFYRGVW